MSSTNWINCSAPLVHFSTKCVNRLLDSCRCSFYRTGITTSAPVSCCPTAALLLLEGRPALWPSGISHPRRPVSKPSWPPRRRPATHSPSAPTLRCVSPAAATGTLPSGTFTTKPLSGGQERHFGIVLLWTAFYQPSLYMTWFAGSSRATQTVPVASTSLTTAPSCGQAVLTTRFVLGTSERDGNSNSTTLHLRLGNHILIVR